LAGSSPIEIVIKILSMDAIISMCTLDTLTKAAANLKRGGIVAFPTETVYGLGVDATNEAAVHRMYQVKGRPADHPVIVHIASKDDVNYWTQNVPDYAVNLMRDFWPGPMTLLLERSENVGDFITGRQSVVGIRIPDHVIALNLLNSFKKVGGKGIAAPSANRFGAVSPTSAAAVKAELEEYLAPDDQILDGGQSIIGVESTIIDCTKANPIVLRPGAVTAAMIEQSTGIVLTTPESEAPRVSGSLTQHYSPNAFVRIGVDAAAGDGFIALEAIATPAGAIRLASPKTDDQYARELYAALRAGDEQQLESIWIVPPTGDGLAVAIRDRIERASNYSDSCQVEGI
jgi:L-threonylcarbamoyladenylate synthase